MGQSLDQMLAGAIDGVSRVNVTIASNEDDGVASFAQGQLVFHAGNLEKGLPASLQPDPGVTFTMFFSDRHTGLQPFAADQTEQLGVSITLGTTGAHVMHLAVFGTNSPVRLSPMGDLLVGLGPSLSRSAAGVFVASFKLPDRP